jgi:hypothetical protein
MSHRFCGWAVQDFRAAIVIPPITCTAPSAFPVFPAPGRGMCAAHAPASPLRCRQRLFELHRRTVAQRRCPTTFEVDGKGALNVILTGCLGWRGLFHNSPTNLLGRPKRVAFWMESLKFRGL